MTIAPVNQSIELEIYSSENTTPPIEKLIQNNKVAIILSNSYFQGWTTMTDDKELQLKMLFDPELANLLLLNCKNIFTQKAVEKYGSLIFDDLTLTERDIPECKVVWVDVGSVFVVDVTENGETLVTLNNLVLVQA